MTFATFAPCLIDEALHAHIDRVALLTGTDAYAWVLQRLVFHEVWRTRNPFLPHHTKQERKTLSKEIARRIAAEREEVRWTAASVLSEAKRRCMEIQPRDLRQASETLLQWVQKDLCTELLDVSAGRAYFIARLDQDISAGSRDQERTTIRFEKDTPGASPNASAPREALCTAAKALKAAPL